MLCVVNVHMASWVNKVGNHFVEVWLLVSAGGFVWGWDQLGYMV